MDLTSREMAMLVLIVKLRILELRESGKDFSQEVNILKKLEERNSAK